MPFPYRMLAAQQSSERSCCINSSPRRRWRTHCSSPLVAIGALLACPFGLRRAVRRPLPDPRAARLCADLPRHLVRTGHQPWRARRRRLAGWLARRRTPACDRLGHAHARRLRPARVCRLGARHAGRSCSPRTRSAAVLPRLLAAEGVQRIAVIAGRRRARPHARRADPRRPAARRPLRRLSSTTAAPSAPPASRPSENLGPLDRARRLREARTTST